jgi:tetratricopeptide (TPR) repeat protein
MRFIPPDYHVMAAKVILTTAPKSPFAAQALVERDWANQKTNAAEYEQWGRGIASHLGLIGIKYLDDGRTEDAYRCFEAYLKLVKDEWVYRRMAGAQLKAGNIDGWLKNMEAYLRDSEDYGLSHARVRMEIARELMERNKYDQARPYVLESAQSGAEWALLTAAECHEGLGEFDQAWQLLVIKSERYQSNPFVMSMFCWRTGKGDLEAAERHAQNAIRRNAGPDRAGIAHYHYLKGDKKSALQWYRRALPNDTISVGLGAALAADEAGDKLLRDEALNRVIVKGRDSAQPPDQLAIAKILQQALARGEKELPDLAAVDRLIASENVVGQLTLREAVGRFLLLRGEKERSIQYLTAAVASSQMLRYSFAHSWKALKDAGVDPAKARADALKK